MDFIQKLKLLWGPSDYPSNPEFEFKTQLTQRQVTLASAIGNIKLNE